MLTLRCRVICQEDGATYNPHLRIISTKDGEMYRDGSPGLYKVEESSLDNTCNSASPIRDYEYHITALSDTLNESIAMCGLFYRPESGSPTEHCYVPSIVWIVLPEQPTMTPKALQLNTTIPPIPKSVSITFITLAAVCISVILVVLLIMGIVFLYKRVSKTRKRKISAQVTHDGSAATRPHPHRGGPCIVTVEDLESRAHTDDTRTGHLTTSNSTS